MTDRTQVLRFARGATIAVHLLLAGVLLGMAVPLVWTVSEQLSSDYVPDWYWMSVLLVGLPIALAVLTLLALGAWLRGRTFLLIGIDFTTFLSSWTALIPFFLASYLPLVLIVLAPIALVMAFWVPRSAAGW